MGEIPGRHDIRCICERRGAIDAKSEAHRWLDPAKPCHRPPGTATCNVSLGVTNKTQENAQTEVTGCKTMAGVS